MKLIKMGKELCGSSNGVVMRIIDLRGPSLHSMSNTRAFGKATERRQKINKRINKY